MFFEYDDQLKLKVNDNSGARDYLTILDFPDAVIYIESVEEFLIA